MFLSKAGNKASTAALLLGLCLASACATQPATQPANSTATDPESLVRFLTWFEGEYDNHEQVWQQAEDGVLADDRHEHIHHIFKRVAAPNIGEHTYFVKQYLDGNPDNVYRQRLYKFTWDHTEQAVRLAIFNFADEAKHRESDEDPSALLGLTAEHVTNKPGCDVFWTFHDDHYLGQLKEDACFYYSSRLKKNIYLTDTLKLTDAAIWIGDKAFDEAGNKIFGRDEQHVNRKVRYFTGWAAIRTDRIDATVSETDDMTFFANLRLHNEGERIALVNKAGKKSGYSIELARLTYQNTRTAILKLGLIEDSTGKTFTYTWANPLASRIGVNLRWMQVGLTAEDIAASPNN